MAKRKTSKQILRRKENFPTLLKKAAAEFSSRTAVAVPGKYELTHGRLDVLVDETAQRLVRMGIRPGDVVTLTFPNTAEINCALVPKEGVEIEEEEFLRFCKRNLVGYKEPKRVFFMDSIPRTATGKIQRRLVAEHCLTKVSAATLPNFGA